MLTKFTNIDHNALHCIEKTHQHYSEYRHTHGLLTLPEGQNEFISNISACRMCECAWRLCKYLHTWLFQRLALGSGHRLLHYWSSPTGHLGRADHLQDHLETQNVLVLSWLKAFGRATPPLSKPWWRALTAEIHSSSRYLVFLVCLKKKTAQVSYKSKWFLRLPDVDSKVILFNQQGFCWQEASWSTEIFHNFY